MKSLILQTAARYLLPIMLLFSIFLLLRGHQEPGGGFVAGLVASAALVLHAVAFDPVATRGLLWLDPRVLLGAGLSAAVASGLDSCLLGEPFLTGQWAAIVLPGIGKFDLGTPLLFDLGVYLVVVGTVLTMILSLAEQ